MNNKEGKDKFDYAITGIFICAILVSFNHTIDLYKSAGFDVPVQVLSSVMDYFFGNKVGNLFTLALFATIAAEAAFSVGLWGLFEAFKVERVFPSPRRYKSTWLVFIGGLLVIGWSNVGGSLGFDYLFGNPFKGYILGLSMPYFVLNSVLVNFSRTYKTEQTEVTERTEPKWKTWIQTAKEIKSEVSTLVESNKQTEQVNTPNNQTPITEQIEQVEISNNQTPSIEQTEQTELIQPIIHDNQQQIEQVHSEQDQTEQNEQNTVQDKPNKKKDRTPLFVVQPNKQQPDKTSKPNTKQNKTNKTELAVQYVTEQIEQNKNFTARSVANEIGCAPSTAQTAINRAKQNSR